MAEVNRATPPASLPSVAAVIELLKPITWFPPMWAFACGAVSAGVAFDGRWWMVLAGVILAGPLLCAMSQAVNDWFDRDVDAINQPGRPIPSGRIPGRWGLGIAVAWSVISLLVAAALGAWVFGAALVGLLLAWAYSAPPLRLKRNGWWGNLAVGVSYEGLAWITGAAVMLGGSAPPAAIVLVALLYSVGAHGIMTLNDFKSMAGDRRTGVGSLPVRLGPIRAAWVACGFMIVPQLMVVLFLFAWGQPLHALAVATLVLIQIALMVRFLQRPVERALWYSAAGVNFFVLGMMVSAFAMRVPSA